MHLSLPRNAGHSAFWQTHPLITTPDATNAKSPEYTTYIYIHTHNDKNSKVMKDQRIQRWTSYCYIEVVVVFIRGKDCLGLLVGIKKGDSSSTRRRSKPATLKNIPYPAGPKYPYMVPCRRVDSPPPPMVWSPPKNPKP